jgi:hypothetical protein
MSILLPEVDPYMRRLRVLGRVLDRLQVWISYWRTSPWKLLSRAATSNTHPTAFRGSREAMSPPTKAIAKLGITAWAKDPKSCGSLTAGPFVIARPTARAIKP